MYSGAHPLSVAEPTLTSHYKQWGRAWAVTITSRVLQTGALPQTPDLIPIFYQEVIKFEQKSWLTNGHEGIHLTFDTTQNCFQAYWWCDVVIYNLNAPTNQDLIKYGMTCQVDAGYQDGAFGTVFIGTVFQPLWEKENGTDWKLTLRCIVGAVESVNNLLSGTVPGGLNQRQLVAGMMSSASTPLTIKMDDFPNQTRVTRATTYFGQANDFLQFIADSNNGLLWFSDLTAHIAQLVEDTTVPEKEFSTDNGLIGTPQQTEFGVTMKVLMSPDLILRGQVKLAQSTVIKQMVLQQGNYPSIITQDYRYIIGQLRHYGDTRGNDWYTEITAFYNSDALLAAMSLGG